MKKFALTMVALMAFTFSFAETKGYGADRNARHFDRSYAIDFDMSCDMRRLSAVLNLNEWQMEAVEAIQNCFNNEIQSLASMRGPQLRHHVRQAVKKDAEQMQRVLNEKQFSAYMLLLGTTLRNKHL
jgi:hypothetical protein